MRVARLRSAGLLGLVLAVALVAAGCGEKSDTGGGSTGTTAAAPAVDEALAAKVPAEVKSDGKIVIGTDPTYAPNEFLETDGKTVTGFDVELFNAVAAKLGLKTEWQPAKFDAIIPGRAGWDIGTVTHAFLLLTFFYFFGHGVLNRRYR